MSLKQPSKERSLVYLRPDIAVQWHPTKNNSLKLEEATVKSNKKVWWKCPKSELHVWEASINNRTRNETACCPFCSGNKVCADNNLAFLRPDITADWHPTKNPDLTPEQVTVGSGVRVWWQCSKNTLHVWEAIIGNRTKGTGCPECYSLSRKN